MHNKNIEKPNVLIKHYLKEIKKRDITQSLDASKKINQTLMHQSILVINVNVTIYKF